MKNDARADEHGEPELVVASGSDAHASSSDGGPRRESLGLKDLSTKVDAVKGDEPIPPYEDVEAGEDEVIHHAANKDDILTHTIHLDDDPTQNAITVRSIVLGAGLSVFGGVLSGIYYFKPQTVTISTVFLAVLSFLLAEAWSICIPRKGRIGRLLNPHPFNNKEHLFITIMANSAGISAIGIEILAAERLYYNDKLGSAVGVFMLFSSQFLGYGIAGLMRRSLVYPKCMLWPYDLPVASMIENLHTRRPENRKPLKVFLIIFICIFFWEVLPQYIMPILTGVSVFCLANQHSAVFTNLFGGASGNEGLGFLSLCFDWQYISGGMSPLYFPMESLISQGVGISGCILLFCALYYGNVFNAKAFPFLSQAIFSNQTDPARGHFPQWNQTFVIGADNQVNKTALDIIGLPSFSTTNASYILTTNMSTTGAIVWVLMTYPREMMLAFGWLDVRKWTRPRPGNWLQKTKEIYTRGHIPYPNEDFFDPHYKVMMKYKAVPDWWFALVLLLSTVIGLVVIYQADSTLPWWAFFVACFFGYIWIAFFGAMQAITGITWLIQSVVQLIAGYMLPANPVANMWFSLYSYNAVIQGQYLLQDLKLSQYGHLAPRLTFTAQMVGTLIGAIFNWIMANNIVTNQRKILTSVEGTNVWSGQQVQTFNSEAITFGALAHELFSVGGKYQWLVLAFLPGFLLPLPCWILHKRFPQAGFNNINLPIITLYLGWLSVGINSSLMAFFLIGLFAQWYLRKHHPNIFVRYNYLVSAALDGGTSVIVFILSFAVLGAAGKAVPFPIYWGNNANGNLDLCKETESEN